MRKLTLFIVLGVMLTLIGSASAQLMNKQYCGDLSEADCAVLTGVQYPDSATYGGDGAINVTVDDQLYSVGLQVDGSYITNQEIAAKFLEYGQMEPSEMFSMMYSDVDTLLQLMDDVFSIVDADLTITLDVPASLTGGMLPSPFMVDVWLVDGVGYTDVSAFSFADPSLQGVLGIDLGEMYAGLIGEAMSDPEAGAMMDELLASQGEAMSDLFADDGAFMNEFMTITRLADEHRVDDTIAVFEYNMDIGAMFDSGFFEGIFEAQQQAIIDMDMEMSEDEIAEMEAAMDAVMDAYALAFEGSTYHLVYKVGVDNGYVYEYDLLFMADVDVNEVYEAFSDAMGTGEEEMSLQEMGIPSNIAINFGLRLGQGNFGTIESINLPEDAVILPSSMFAPAMSGDA